MKLLVVDDSVIIRTVIQKIFADDERITSISHAGDGIEALEVFKKTKPDLVTMDITMPEMDGLKCIEEIMKVNPNVKIIVITALSHEAIALQAMDKGASAFINKPFKNDQLRAAIEKIL